MESSASSSKPISSKFPMSVKMLSGSSIWEEEWKEEDLEDLDPDNSGGELGVGQTVVMVSYVVQSQTRWSSTDTIGIQHTRDGVRTVRVVRKGGSRSHARLGCRFFDGRRGVMFSGGDQKETQ